MEAAVLSDDKCLPSLAAKQPQSRDMTLSDIEAGHRTAAQTQRHVHPSAPAQAVEQPQSSRTAPQTPTEARQSNVVL